VASIARDVVVEMTPPRDGISYNAPMHFRHRQTDGETDGH